MPSLLHVLGFTSCFTFALCQRAGAVIEADRFEKEVVVTNCTDPLALDFAKDGRIFFIERRGAVKCFDPATHLTQTLLQLSVMMDGDGGALALLLDRDFARTAWVFVYYTSHDEGQSRMRLARYTLHEGRLDEEKRVLDIPLEQTTTPYHCGGGLAWDVDGNLLLGAGDNSAPQDVPAIHPLDKLRDSRRSAGNSKDLRGKVLRFTPQADGSHTIPKGNLFGNPADGCGEIYAMGVRNPFRVTADPATGLIAWGDVGGNVNPEYGLGPEGYDEINITRQPGFFGWPWLSGPAGPWRPFDPKTNHAAGDFFDAGHIINDSEHNTGLKILPPALPPVLYYSNPVSEQWPFLGSGGRSLTGGVFYRTDSKDGQRLPDEWKGAYIFGDWMRNWVALAHLTPEGKLISAEPLAAQLSFRRPADFKIGPEGALYIAEYGEKWTGNTNGQITRIVYRRGNRVPGIVLTANCETGRAPLLVEMKAIVNDPDEPAETLKVQWEFPDGMPVQVGTMVKAVFANVGVWQVRATVTDNAGLSASALLKIAVGNEAPTVKFISPPDGGFFDYDQPIPWNVQANDREEGALPAEQVRVEMARRDYSPRSEHMESFPGLAMMRRTTCFACHQTSEKSAGPAYLEVARRYVRDAEAPARLARKIQSGGVGVWGELPMPPHPQHSIAECAQMVDWVLSLAQSDVVILPSGLEGIARVEKPREEWGRPQNGVLVFTATATDRGAGALPRLVSAPTIVQLRTRRQRASCYDAAVRATRQDNLDQGGMVARISSQGGITFLHLNLNQCSGILMEGWPQGSGTLHLEVRSGLTVLGKMDAQAGPGKGIPKKLNLPFTTLSEGMGDLTIQLSGAGDALLDLMWVEFLPRK